MSISKRARETTTYAYKCAWKYIYIYSRTTTSEDLRCCCSLYGIIIFLSRFVVGKSESSGASCQGRKKGREEEREAVCCETNEFSKIVLRKRGGGGTQRGVNKVNIDVVPLESRLSRTG